MSGDLTLIGIFFAGLLSFLSPCVLPLVPPYLTYLAGVSLDEIAVTATLQRGGLVDTSTAHFPNVDGLEGLSDRRGNILLYRCPVQSGSPTHAICRVLAGC